MCKESEEEEALVIKNSFNSKCSKHCEKKCGVFHSEMASEDKETLIDDFSGTKQDFKRKLLNYLKVQKSVGISDYGICYMNHLFCPHVFSIVTNRSVYVIKKVLSDHRDGVQRYLHGNMKKRCSRATTNFVAWMLNFVNCYGQDAPDTIVKVLPSYLYKSNTRIST